uniref:Peptidase M1 membrane alanine aminopeptidase domain-containing protein n=1 Tax=Ascaris lumbricoides TaxID=6252 RepID=A0A9J2PVD0_ASCLU
MHWVVLLLIVGPAAIGQDFTPDKQRMLKKGALYDGEYDIRGKARYADSFLPGSTGERERRIPEFVEPIEYFIQIQPYFENDKIAIPEGRANMTFDGRCTFIFRVKQQTRNVTLHSLLLIYERVTLMDEEGETLITNASYSFNETLNHIIIDTEDHLTVGKTYMLQFVYTGEIHDYLDTGLYYTSYDDTDGNSHFMLATHLQPARARWVFPCLDEPAYKAVFHITLIYPKGLIALANAMERTPVSMKPPLGDWEVIQFPPSLKMSTYLVAFAIGPYVKAETINEDGILVRSWGWTGQEEYLEFAVNVSAKCLHTMGNYLNYTYPYIKSDQIGLPEFVAGAMENFGLIVYKYQYVAIHPKISTTEAKQAAAKVICHELAHQWFGNTVTAAWWDDLFLNEGFASFFERFNMKLAIPSQKPYIETKWYAQRVQPSLVFDADLSKSHPLYAYNGPEFDTITYGKGASVLRMIYSVLGEEAFQSALQDYIKEYQFSNAVHQNLFDKFTACNTNFLIFAAITYGKGASVLRMIYSVLGEEAFQSALQDYIKEYQFSSAVHQNLFDKFIAV